MFFHSWNLSNWKGFRKDLRSFLSTIPDMTDNRPILNTGRLYTLFEMHHRRKKQDSGAVPANFR